MDKATGGLSDSKHFVSFDSSCHSCSFSLTHRFQLAIFAGRRKDLTRMARNDELHELFSSQETMFAVEWADAFLSPPFFMDKSVCLTQTSGWKYTHPTY